MSTIIADNLTGKTSAGSITVTSEGGAATQSLQQGLAKVWAKYGMDDNTVDDSLNLSSLTDNSTGDFTNNWTNAFGAISYSTLANASVGNGGSSINKQDFYIPTTSSVRLFTTYHNGTGDTGSGTAYDYALISLLAHGDLA